MKLELEITAHDSIPTEELLELTHMAAREEDARYPGRTDTVYPTKEYRIVTASYEGKIVGLAAWQEWEGKAFIGQAWTAPSFRRKGVYRRIVAKVTAEARRLGLSHVAACVCGLNVESREVHRRLLGIPDVVLFSAKLGVSA